MYRNHESVSRLKKMLLNIISSYSPWCICMHSMCCLLSVAVKCLPAMCCRRCAALFCICYRHLPPMRGNKMFAYETVPPVCGRALYLIRIRANGARQGFASDAIRCRWPTAGALYQLVRVYFCGGVFWGFHSWRHMGLKPLHYLVFTNPRLKQVTLTRKQFWKLNFTLAKKKSRRDYLFIEKEFTSIKYNFRRSRISYPSPPCNAVCITPGLSLG